MDIKRYNRLPFLVHTPRHALAFKAGKAKFDSGNEHSANWSNLPREFSASQAKDRVSIANIDNRLKFRKDAGQLFWHRSVTWTHQAAARIE